LLAVNKSSSGARVFYYVKWVDFNIIHFCFGTEVPRHM